MTRSVVYDMGLHCLNIYHNKGIIKMCVHCMFTDKPDCKAEYCLSLC